MWALEKLPHRPFIQSVKFNSHSGGILRHFQPLECDVTQHVADIMEQIKADKDREFHLDVNQYRVYATQIMQGVSVPEGMHQDGHEIVGIMVYRRQSINGAELSLHRLDTREIFIKTIIQENEAIVIEDEKMLHDATNVTASSTEIGVRDYIVVNINSWENRRYGPEFERDALPKNTP